MKRIIYDKLIRDRIPEIIEQQGKPYETMVMSVAEYRKALATKLVEESKEVLEASDHPKAALVKELSDVFEILDSILQAYEIGLSDVVQMQEIRREKRGGFSKRLRLLWVEEDDGT